MTMKLDAMIDQLFLLVERKRELEAEIKRLKQSIGADQSRLIGRFGDVGTNYARGQNASATLTETVVPVIEDWGQVSEWVMENDAIYLLHRRVASGPWKELRDSGVEVPGIEPFTKTSISLRRLGD